LKIQHELVNERKEIVGDKGKKEVEVGASRVDRKAKVCVPIEEVDDFQSLSNVLPISMARGGGCLTVGKNHNVLTSNEGD
jgi:hypothetical protein